MKGLKRRLKGGETLLGCWSNLGSPVTAEILGLSGFDWILTDLEHGAGTEADLLGQMQALSNTPAASIVRVESVNPQRISRVLDMGAEGVMCPRVSRPDQADEVVSSLRYPPHGRRGVARMVRATEFGKQFRDYYVHADETLLGIVQIETAEALNHLEAISETEGVDVLFIGPADLSMELGIYGEFGRPEFRKAVERVVEAAEKRGRATGILLSDPADFRIYREMGIRFIACGSDATFVSRGATDTIEQLRAARTETQKRVI